MGLLPPVIQNLSINKSAETRATNNNDNNNKVLSVAANVNVPFTSAAS